MTRSQAEPCKCTITAKLIPNQYGTVSAFVANLLPQWQNIRPLSLLKIIELILFSADTALKRIQSVPTEQRPATFNQF